MTNKSLDGFTLEDTMRHLDKRESQLKLQSKLLSFTIMFAPVTIFTIISLSNNMSTSMFIIGFISMMVISYFAYTYIINNLFMKKWVSFKKEYEVHETNVIHKVSQILQCPAEDIFIRTSLINESFTITAEKGQIKKTLELTYAQNDFTYMQ